MRPGSKSRRGSSRAVEDYLIDILTSISRIEQYLAGVAEEQFLADAEKQDAVSRRLLVIGEASKYIPKALREMHPDIPWTSIVGMRNVLSHAYHDEDPRLIWRTTQLRLSPLRVAIQGLLDQLAQSPES